MTAPRILLNITHGFQARMLLRTEISERLLEAGAELIVVAPNADEDYFRREFERPGITLEKTPQRYTKPEKAVVSTRAYFLMNPRLGETLNFKRERYKRAHPMRYWVTRAGNLVLGNVPALRKLYLEAEARVFNGAEYDDLLARHRPSLVVSGTPGFNVFDCHLLRAARRARIPSATVMLSWDNLTSKGYMGAQPGHLLVWNQLMADEARQYHEFAGPITEVGAAQFDVYRQVGASFDGAGFRREQELPEGARLIVWGTINEDIYPGQMQLLRRYATEIERGPEGRVLWVRVHPQSVTGPHAALAREYLALASERVRIEIPAVASETLRWDLPKRDMIHLAELLTAADLLITPQSTLTIDAACAGTPIINLAIDEHFRNVFRYTHYQNLLRSGGIWVVEDVPELLEATDRYLADPSHHQLGREAIVAQQMGRQFGRAGQSTAEALWSLAGGPSARESQGRVVGAAS